MSALGPHPERAGWFRQAVLDIREAWSDRKFWERAPEHREGAVAGLTIAYLTDPTVTENDYSLMQATLNEYLRREAYVRQARGITGPIFPRAQS